MLLRCPINTYEPFSLRETDEAAQALSVAAVPIESSEDIEDAFQRIVKEHVGAVDVLQSAQFARMRAEIAELGLKYQLPTIAGSDSFVLHGGLIKYGPNVSDNFRQAAVYVDKILGPPVSQPTKLELAVNLKTATRPYDPPTLLARVDEVIE